MTLQVSGAISLLNIQNEFGGSSPISISEYYNADTGIPVSGVIAFDDFYGRSDYTAISAVTISASPTSASNSASCIQNNGTCFVSSTVSLTANVTGGDSGNYIYNWIKTGGFGLVASTNGSASRAFSISGSIGADSSSSGAEIWRCNVQDGISNVNSAAKNISVTIYNDGQDTGCFSWDTQIWLDDGSYKNAEDIIVGDKVKAFTSPTMIDESLPDWKEWTDTGLLGNTLEQATVVRAHSYITPSYQKINNEIKVTGEHPFLAYRYSFWQWVNASDLSIGDLLYGSDGSHIPITSNEHINLPIEVMNIGVEDVDTYFGGSLNGKSVLGHNK